MKKIVEKIRNIDDKYKILFFRWWFSAAVCFFIAWGLSFGEQESTFELIFFLGLAMAIGNLFIFNPIISSVFDIKRRGKIANKKMSERTILEGVFYFLSECFKSMLAVYIVAWIYEGINLLINYIKQNPDNKIEFGIEPIMFGIIFTIIYLLLGLLWDLVIKLFDLIFRRKKNDIIQQEQETRSEA